MTGTRRSVRALLFADSERIVLIERRRPNRPPYLTLPGGGIEPGECAIDALIRELLEELGARAAILEQVPHDDEATIVYRCRLLSMDASLATGEEHTDLSRGAYITRTMTRDEVASSGLPVYPHGIVESD